MTPKSIAAPYWMRRCWPLTTIPARKNTNGPQTVPQETRPPTITLNGGSPMSIMVGTSFTDPGAVGADCYGNVLPVTTSGSVNTGVAGTNTLTYVTTDEFSVTVTNTRIVAVVSKVMISLDYGPSGSTVPAPAGFTKVLYAGGGAAGNMTVSNAGGSPYTLVCTNIKAYNGGGSGSTLDKDGLYTSAGATAGFSLTGLQTNLPVGLWACYGWDGTGKGANVVWAGATNSLTTAESVTSRAPIRCNISAPPPLTSTGRFREPFMVRPPPKGRWAP